MTLLYNIIDKLQTKTIEKISVNNNSLLEHEKREISSEYVSDLESKVNIMYNQMKVLSDDNVPLDMVPVLTYDSSNNVKNKCDAISALSYAINELNPYMNNLYEKILLDNAENSTLVQQIELSEINEFLGVKKKYSNGDAKKIFEKMYNILKKETDYLEKGELDNLPEIVNASTNAIPGIPVAGGRVTNKISLQKQSDKNVPSVEFLESKLSFSNGEISLVEQLEIYETLGKFSNLKNNVFLFRKYADKKN